ncbi:MAG TPA: hypothetical protein ENJ41_02575 [Oceanospirillales bacterium]|nr:hypothetical protein [Oceanospirillales bacterium]
MKLILLITALVFASSCQSHPHKHKVVLVDNHHRHHDYVIIKVRPHKHRVCKKHRKHWHCVK